MHEQTDLRDMFDRAVEDTVLPAELGARAVAGGRARVRRRRIGLAAGLAVAVGCAALVVVPDTGRSSPDTVAVEADPLREIAIQAGHPVGPGDVLVQGQAGTETLIALTRQANETERKSGGKAAELWVVEAGGSVRRVSDYLSYDFACLQGDTVCEKTRPRGLGFAAVRVTPQGEVFVAVAVPTDRTVTVTSAEGQSNTVRTPGIVEVRTEQPWKVKITVSLADNESYVLPLPPGGVVEG